MNTLYAQQLNTMFTMAYNEHNRSLNNFALRKLNNYEVSKDVVQQAFIKTWMYLMRGEKIQSIKPFLYRTINNLIVDEYRKHKTLSLETLVEGGLQVEEPADEERVDPFDKKNVLDLIDKLPPKSKAVMHMRYRKGLTIEEISNITSKSKNTISVQLHRGSKKLKELCNVH